MEDLQQNEGSPALETPRTLGYMKSRELDPKEVALVGAGARPRSSDWDDRYFD